MFSTKQLSLRWNLLHHRKKTLDANSSNANNKISGWANQARGKKARRGICEICLHQQVSQGISFYPRIAHKQDKVNTADPAFIFLIIQSQNQGGEDGLVWSGLC